MPTLGYGDIFPKNYYALYIIIPQTLIGIFIAIIILARLLSIVTIILIYGGLKLPKWMFSKKEREK